MSKNFAICTFIACFCLVAGLGSIGHAGDLTTLSERRAERLLAKFEGNYLFGAFDGNSEATAVVENGYFSLWEAHGRTPCGSFKIPLLDLGKTVVSSYRSGFTVNHVERTYSLEGDSLIFLETVTSRFKMSVEHQELRLEGSELVVTQKRNYFVRALRSAYRWTPDRGFDYKRNTLDLTRRMVRISAKPWPTHFFIDHVRAKPEVYYVVKKGPVNSDTLTDAIVRGDIEAVDARQLFAGPQPQKSATIFQFSKSAESGECEKPFDL